jgi:phage tail sheath gpL-like
MANQLYPFGRQSFLDGDIDWTANNIKVVLVDTTYVFSTAHDFLADVAADVVATSANLTGKTATNGTADADDVLFTAVSGAQVGFLVIYQDTGNAATSRLIAYIDTATGLPVTPNGGDITITWDNGANRIFTL